ncbi:MAG: hypothetical protein PHE83_17180 [Opitutaceae bacterium]|nr:hypothetical protein [Opitutaceae bacterium]
MTLRRLLLFAVLSGAVASVRAQLPQFQGYTAGTLPHNLPLPVEVVGGGLSEQACPVILYLPEAGAGPIEGAHPAAALPELPANAAGYRLMVLDQTIETPLALRDGGLKNARIPVFAYCPQTGQNPDPEMLRARLQAALTPPGANDPGPAADAGAFSLERVITALPPATAGVPPAPRKLVLAELPPARQPPPANGNDKTDAPLPKTTGRTDFTGTNDAPTPGKPPASVIPPTPAANWDDVLANPTGSDLKNSMTVGAVIGDERQRLRSRLPVHGEFIARPLSEVLLQLATASGIDFSIGALPAADPIVTTRFTAAPFCAMEQIGRQYGIGIYHDDNDPLWVIRRVDPETLIARTYQLKEIHLGDSSGASGNESIGATFDMINTNMGGSGGNQNGGYGAGSRRNGLNGNSGSTAYNNSSTSLASTSGLNGGAATSATQLAAQNFEDRFTQPSDVLFTIKSILGLVEKTPLVSELNNSPDNPDAPRLRTEPAANNATRVNGLVSYNADANSLFVVGTERQHQWVGEYLRLVDRAPVTIAIDALFVESDVNPNEQLGIDWSESALNWHLGATPANATTTDAGGNTVTTTTLPFGTLAHPKLPGGAILSGDTLGAKLSALVSESNSHVARYPRVVTSNNREVRIATTSNIPIITAASTVAGAVALNTNPAGGTSSSGTVQTNFSAGTQEIGTIITLLPARIDDNKIYLKIAIEISSGESASSGEKLTGRIPTTSTTYEGEVVVEDGKTLAIGGLERIAETSGITRLPGISQIPLFGFLFKKKDMDFRRTNISLFLTPRLLHPDAQAAGSQRHSQTAVRALRESAHLEDLANKQPE